MKTHRHGFTLMEILMVVSLLVGFLMIAWVFGYEGFRGGVGIDRRETADALSRDLLARYSRLAFVDLEEMFAGREVLDPAEHEAIVGEDAGDAPFRDAGFERRLRFEPVGGVLPGALLRTEVRYRLPGGAKRVVGHSRYLVAPEGIAEGMRSAGGFQEASRVPGWGQRTRWGADPDAVAGELESRVAAAAGPARRAAHRVVERERTRAGRGDRKPTGFLDPGADEEEQAAAVRALPLAGDPGALARLTGKGGALARRLGDEKVMRAARAARARRRFLARAGLPREHWLEEDIPDGTYRYHLEAVDLRDSAGEGKRLGVFVLRDAQGEEYRLVHEAVHAGGSAPGGRGGASGGTNAPGGRGGASGGTDVLRSFEGDAELWRGAFRNRDGRAVQVVRTEERLYALRRGPDPLDRRVVIRTLSGMDGSREGTTVTRRETKLLAHDLGLTAAAGEPADLLADALPPEDPAPPVRLAKAARGCRRGGTCGLTRTFVPVENPGLAPATGGSAAPRPAHDPRLLRARQRADGAPWESLRLLDELLAEVPGDLEARLLRGRLRAMEGDRAGALSDLQEVSRHPDAPPEVLGDLAGLLMQAGRLDDARVYVQRFASIRPTDPMTETLESSLADLDALMAAPGDPGEVPEMPGGGGPPEGIAAPSGGGRGAFMSWTDNQGNSGSVAFTNLR